MAGYGGHILRCIAKRPDTRLFIIIRAHTPYNICVLADTDNLHTNAGISVEIFLVRGCTRDGRNIIST
jgi:hypothetical protein